MMAAKQRHSRLIDRLPPVRGRITENAPLDRITWFRVGGPAEVMFRPADRDDLAAFLAGKPADVPITAIGVGSNLLVRDGGVPGVVVRLGREFAGVVCEGTHVRAGAAAFDLKVAMTAAEAGLAGLEFLSGIPGTIGGAVRMNAGAYGREIRDVIIEAETFDPQGELHTLSLPSLGLAYRHCSVPEDWIFTSVLLEGTTGDYDEIARRMEQIRSAREETQPIRSHTGGSTFANPEEPAAEGRRAWQLIEASGCRGLRRGGAMVSEKHCNFLINTGGATAQDIESLGEEVRRRVYEMSGIRLRWEIRIVGVPATQGPHETTGGEP